MQGKSTNKIQFKATKTQKSFSAESLTQYGGLSSLFDYVVKLNIPKIFDDLFPTVKHNATKFSTTQILLSFLCASLCGVKRVSRIETFTRDTLVNKLLGLKKYIDQDTLGSRLSKMGQSGAIILHERMMRFSKEYMIQQNLETITLDLDSTEQTVYGRQQGAQKGYNPHKRGARCYHPIVCYVSELKYLLNSWFRTGSSYTANGVVEFIKQTLTLIPTGKQVFLRADSGFFNGALFDLLEEKGHTYLVKVKLKNLKTLLNAQTWITLGCNTKMAVCQFQYKGNKWTKTRTLYGIRILKRYEEVEILGKKEQVPVYEYFCYCSNLPNQNGDTLNQLYRKRAESENWIEQAKNHLLAAQTLMQNFHGNDIMWQLSVLAYNISIMMRHAVCKKAWKEEYITFRDWYVRIPAKVVNSARKIEIKMAKYYYESKRWIKLHNLIVQLE